MNGSDLVAMIGNLSRSLSSVDTLISGLGYLIGILFMITATLKLKKIGDARASSSSHEKMFVPVAYFVGGTALIFLPSMLGIVSNTTFGMGNILEYIPYNPYSIYNSMGILIQTAGLIWFVRGCVLLVHGSEPGVQEGPKGLAFVAGGILAMNFEYTLAAVNYVVSHLLDLTGMV
jgi:hypothetical protein